MEPRPLPAKIMFGAVLAFLSAGLALVAIVVGFFPNHHQYLTTAILLFIISFCCKRMTDECVEELLEQRVFNFFYCIRRDYPLYQGPITTAEIAKQLNASEAKVRVICDRLAAEGVIKQIRTLFQRIAYQSNNA